MKPPVLRPDEKPLPPVKTLPMAPLVFHATAPITLVASLPMVASGERKLIASPVSQLASSASRPGIASAAVIHKLPSAPKTPSPKTAATATAALPASVRPKPDPKGDPLPKPAEKATPSEKPKPVTVPVDKTPVPVLPQAKSPETASLPGAIPIPVVATIAGTVEAPPKATETSPAQVAIPDEKPKAEEKEEDAEEAEEAEEKIGAVDPGLLAKAEKAMKDGKWKDLENLFRNNAPLSKDARGAQIKMMMVVNKPKVNTLEVNKLSDEILRRDKKDSYGNFGKGYYWVYTKKSDLGKALTHLALAKAAKDAPPGASGLYWKVLLKKYWIILLVLAGGVVGGVSAAKKKMAGKNVPGQEATEILDETNPAAGATDGAPVIDESPPPTGFRKILAKIREILGKLRRKKAVEIVEIDLSAEMGPAGDSSPETPLSPSEAASEAISSELPANETASGPDAPAEPSSEPPPSETGPG